MPDPIILGRGAGDRGPRAPLPQRRPGGPDQGRAHAHRSLHPLAAQRRAQSGKAVNWTYISQCLEKAYYCLLAVSHLKNIFRHRTLTTVS